MIISNLVKHGVADLWRNIVCVIKQEFLFIMPRLIDATSEKLNIKTIWGVVMSPSKGFGKT